MALLVSSAYAQKDPEDFDIDGFVVLKENPNDTIFGKVNDRSTHLMEHTNAWLMHPDGEIRKHKRKDLLAVGKGNKLFIVKDKIPKGYGSQLLQVDVRGAMTCYTLHNSAGATFFLMKEGQEKMQVLRDIPKGANSFKDQKKMAKYFLDDPEIYAKVKSKEYTPNLAPAVVREYNSRHADSSNGLH